jgi:hypothetical protein
MQQGLTTNGAAGANPRSGGSYGGAGGVWDGSGSNPTYGSVTNPVQLGSGGSGDGGGTPGGNGGGRVTLVISGLLTVDGAVRVDGATGSGNVAGSGSGGSIKISAGTLAGSGTLEADGGGSQAGGGGGRIAVYAATLSYATHLATAAGGSGSFASGLPGTVFFGAPPAPLPGPLPARSVRITGIVNRTTNGPAVLWEASDAGISFVVETSDSLEGAWSNASPVITNTIWTESAPGKGAKFYRIRTP